MMIFSYFIIISVNDSFYTTYFQVLVDLVDILHKRSPLNLLVFYRTSKLVLLRTN